MDVPYLTTWLSYVPASQNPSSCPLFLYTRPTRTPWPTPTPQPTPSRGSSLFPPSSSSSALPPEWQQLDGAKLDELLQQLPQQRAAEVSCKSAFVLALLERLTAEGHRTLIFSQSKVMLNILEVRVTRCLGLRLGAAPLAG